MQSPINNNFSTKTGRTHSELISLFALVGMTITALMGTVSLFNDNLVLTIALFIASLVYLIGYYIYKKFDNIQLCSIIIVYSLYALMFYLVYTGGVGNSGPLWVFIVAPVSVFVHGLKRGLANIAIFLCIITLIMLVPIESSIKATYEPEFILRLLYSFLTVTFLSALYEYSREQSYNHTLELSKKYRQLANVDPLTQLSNRRDALNILKHEQARVTRSKKPLSIMLCDIDFFKKVNDHYGHNAGDAVLVELSNTFLEATRKQDTVARWGGEEFLFILPETPLQNAFVIAEKIRNIVEDKLVHFEGNEIKVTVSIGMCR